MGLKSLTGELRKREKIMIDTNVVIYFLEGNEVFGDLSKEVFSIVEKGEVEGAISVVTVAEILVKPMKLRNNLLIDKITSFLNTFPNLDLIDIDKSIAIEAANIRSKTGLKMPDALIISSAKILNCAIVGTDNQWDKKDLGLEFYNIKEYLVV
ncbi:MAG: PIN domain-containing protein [Firmicutes bacterium]|nr:PIN domain-containing protein [Bacillota bacterium]